MFMFVIVELDRTTITTTTTTTMEHLTFRQEYMQLPLVTRAYTTACVITTILVVSPLGYKLDSSECVVPPA